MSIEKRAPVYGVVMRYVNLIIDELENMPGKYRKVLGDRMFDASLNLLESVHYAYGTKHDHDKAFYLGQFQSGFSLLQTYLRIANERKWISLTKRVNLSELEAEIARQISGWRKSLNKK